MTEPNAPLSPLSGAELQFLIETYAASKPFIGQSVLTRALYELRTLRTTLPTPDHLSVPVYVVMRAIGFYKSHGFTAQNSATVAELRALLDRHAKGSE